MLSEMAHQWAINWKSFLSKTAPIHALINEEYNLSRPSAKNPDEPKYGSYADIWWIKGLSKI